MPVFYHVIPSECVGAFESFPIYMLGFLQPLIIWFVVVMKAAAHVFYLLMAILGCSLHGLVVRIDSHM